MNRLGVPDGSVSARPLELLSPARNLECGLEAVKHGADAVYIGATRFGARASAGNSLEDIAALVSFAHPFGARVYVTVNTILKDSELADTAKLVRQLYDIGVDAILVQDTALLRMELPPIALHASTQMDVRSVEKVRFLAACGFSRVVLARELQIQEIRAIHEACPDVELECFVHGALCVSYSGQCYASEYCFRRSANRGECAQFCRLPFDLTDADGHTIALRKHLLSLKDMNRLDYLEELADAGVTSFKIEGRLKDAPYVKNVTAAYSQRLDTILSNRSDLKRASSGIVHYNFTPDIRKSFNRGFTDYFLHGRTDGIWQFNTPKSTGLPVGTVSQTGHGWIAVQGDIEICNGDGLCYIDSSGTLQGFRINKVEANRIYPYHGAGKNLQIPKGVRLFRNYDSLFEKKLAGDTAERHIPVSISFSDTSEGFKVSLTDCDGNVAVAELPFPHQTARTPQTDNIRLQLSKLGGTIFETDRVEIMMDSGLFVPSSLLTALRRDAVEKLLGLRMDSHSVPPRREPASGLQYPEKTLSYLGNVMNSQAKAFYQEHGVLSVDDAYELSHTDCAVLMYCRHCIRFAMGWCTKRGGSRSPYPEPYILRSADGRTFRLEFDCRNCLMRVRADKSCH